MTICVLVVGPQLSIQPASIEFGPGALESHEIRFTVYVSTTASAVKPLNDSCKACGPLHGGGWGAPRGRPLQTTPRPEDLRPRVLVCRHEGRQKDEAKASGPQAMAGPHGPPGADLMQGTAELLSDDGYVRPRTN